MKNYYSNNLEVIKRISSREPNSADVKKKRVQISEDAAESIKYIGSFSDSTMMHHVFADWVEKLNNDGVFSESDFKGNFNGENCVVSEDNCLEILEALEVHDYISEDEALNLIKKVSRDKDEPEISYAEFKHHLYDTLVIEKNTSFQQLIGSHF